PSKASNPPNAPTPTTGIAELDAKIASKNLSMFDVYLAKNYLGVDLKDQLNGGLEVRAKITNRTKAVAELYDIAKSLDLGKNIIQKAQNNSGFWNGLKRKLNQMSGGLFGIDPELAQTDNALHNYAYAVARALGYGRTNLEQQKDAKEMVQFKVRSAQENTSRMAQTQDINLNYLLHQMNELRALGGEVPQDILKTYYKHKALVNYINERGGVIDLKTFKALDKGF
ncbi:hypothetical protein, partial [Helicobacter baculiformis]